MEFQEQTIKIIIDEGKCAECESKACIAACKTYARGLLVLKDGVPAVEGDTGGGRGCQAPRDGVPGV